MITDPYPQVNLIPIAQIERRQRTRWIGRWIGAVVSTAFVIGIPGVYVGGHAVFTDSGMSGQIENANLEYTNYQQQIPILQSKLMLIKEQSEVLALVKNRLEWRDVFKVLIDAAGNDVRFRRLSAVGGGVEGDSDIEIYLEAMAPSQTIARGYIVELENAQIFDSIELTETRRIQIEQVEIIRFHVVIKVFSGNSLGSEGANAG
ncbi:MAG: hypothetical protein JKX70_11250 [Phycisphaerales bacterium]|nr:hypothetical protein [Phycisphaerales bacterium]